MVGTLGVSMMSFRIQISWPNCTYHISIPICISCSTFRAIPTAYKKYAKPTSSITKILNGITEEFCCHLLPDKLNNTCDSNFYESDFSVSTLYLMLEIKLHTYNLCHLSKVIILFMVNQIFHLFLLVFMIRRRLISSFRQNHIIINV